MEPTVDLGACLPAALRERSPALTKIAAGMSGAAGDQVAPVLRGRAAGFAPAAPAAPAVAAAAAAAGAERAPEHVVARRPGAPTCSRIFAACT